MYGEPKPVGTSERWKLVKNSQEPVKFTRGQRTPTWWCIIACRGRPPKHELTEIKGTLDNGFIPKLTGHGVCLNPKYGTGFLDFAGLATPAQIHSEVGRILTPISRDGVPFVLVILKETDACIYNSIKYWGDVKLGLRTVCVVKENRERSRKFRPGSDQYFSNVALKVNLKLGGTNQRVNPAGQNIIDFAKTMVVGVDVTHPSPGSDALSPSIAGMVASIDKDLGQWPAVLRVQNVSKEEMVRPIGEMLTTRLELWKEKNAANPYPENILIYRDGVSEGQYDLVKAIEIRRLKIAIDEYYAKNKQEKKKPRLTVVIVGKRHHTRFFKGDENPLANTAVDRGVTNGRAWDFFLQAHKAMIGVARPGHYHVVLDEIFRSPKSATQPADPREAAKALEVVTKSMCYIFGRATCAVSVATPAYYADLACGRARAYLHELFSPPTAPYVEWPDDFENLTIDDDKEKGRKDDKDKRPSPQVYSNEAVQLHPRVRDTMFYI